MPAKSSLVAINISSSTTWVQLGTQTGHMRIAIYGLAAFNMRTPFSSSAAANSATDADMVFAGSTVNYITVDPSQTWLRGNSGATSVTWLTQD